MLISNFNVISFAILSFKFLLLVTYGTPNP
jgi:hypothetical protein